ncbi:thermonuclease family protein [Corynebacterium ureicelerivorans]|uniref:thermonuclease family protein n=1 Tax=Corynebacterium ureicelerivorans TaxID=401472 RepID=UPI0026520D82|nr:thermonuclease family protein [Corynebacterium ureicelerivorans]MDN8604935.1 thermonuclease family protein [Corynebacterium ureicelerivorans]
MERIIDGDTLDASIKRETVRIRLLNIDTPEIGRDGNPSECFAEEAKQRLEELVPPGTKVHLEYDQERLDKYGRTLAGVFRGDQFVNEQLAREGLGRAMLVEPNTRFYQRILDAESEPRDAGHGIFGAAPGCFAADSDVQDTIDALVQESQALGEADLDDDASIHVARKRLQTINRLREQLSDEVHQRDLFYETELTHLLDETEEQVRDASAQLDETEARVRKREEERQREEQQRQERIHRQEQTPSSPASGQYAPSAPSAPAVDNYTGCRAYGGNYALSNVDKNGRRYAKIDCSTKVQIG